VYFGLHSGLVRAAAVPAIARDSGAGGTRCAEGESEPECVAALRESRFGNGWGAGPAGGAAGDFADRSAPSLTLPFFRPHISAVLPACCALMFIRAQAAQSPRRIPLTRSHSNFASSPRRCFDDGR